MNRRNFLSVAAATAGLALAKPVFGSKAGSSTLSHKERVDRALRGQDLDRPPFTFYHHYKRPTAQSEAQDHLEFHRAYKTDIVKVMNDFDYPKSTTGKWYELKPLDSPYPDQLETLKLVRDGLNGDAYFIDTIYGPYMTAMILFQSQPQFASLGKSEEVQDRQIKSLHAFQQQNPDAWHGALEAITESTINHIRRAKDIGASGALVSIFNAEKKFGSVEDYERYTRPYDKRIFDALADTKLTILHLHYLERPYLDQFKDFSAPVIQYSVKTSGIPISEVREQYSQPIAGGVDEIEYEKLTITEMRRQWTEAREQAGPKYIAAPGCSVPDGSTPEELARFPRALGIKPIPE
ncbi:uroporphyrinogen decarboxylase family protein [Acidobacterium sp. S8]|uniref:uroporphyrinogen decarboxylase family protein n=1 Tax=Acidobacterium sp. S8 TaxID=1641854 RepID=UPI00131AAC29|nr:uroporphyrinogen decarboxylase family protein [Acidobacterium sp. S8]